MYLNIGKLIDIDDIVGIFDFDNTTTSKKTQKFLQINDKNKNITYIIDDLPKSFIISNNNNKNHVFVSELATKTLQKRMEDKNE